MDFAALVPRIWPEICNDTKKHGDGINSRDNDCASSSFSTNTRPSFFAYHCSTFLYFSFHLLHELHIERFWRPMGSELRTGSEDCFDDDDFPAAPGGKKRKVPAYGQVKSADEINDTKPSAPLFPLKHRFPRTPAYSLCEFRKGLFLRRKAAFIALYIDAQTAINVSSLKHKSTLPDVTSFEKLLPSLEDVGVNSWTPDRSGWREDRAESWRIRCGRKKSGSTMRVERKGWAPEGSFEFEMECQGKYHNQTNIANN